MKRNPIRHIAYLVILTILAVGGMEVLAQQPTGAPAKNESKTYPPGNAWTLSWPLGTRVESTMDTLLYNYQRHFTTAITSDAWATTGQFTGPAMNMIYFQRPESSDFYFNNAISYWLPSFSKQKFYNVYIPMTQLSYGWGYGTESRTDYLQAVFAGNVNRKIGFGAWIEYPYTIGSYANQSAKGIGYGLTGYYNGDRYEMQAFFNQFNHKNRENGGITDDLYITDPAKLQGGVNSIEPKSIPVNLTAAQNRLTGSEFYMSHAYKVGFWRDLTQPEDTVERREYVPVTKFVYTFDWQTNHHTFVNNNASDASKFWDNTYFDLTGTNDDAYHWSVTNTVGIEMIEGFQKWAKFGLAAYASYEIDRYSYSVPGLGDIINPPMPDYPEEPVPDNEGLSPLPDVNLGNFNKTRNRLWIGGRLEKTKGSIIRYAADAKFGLLGDAIGEIDIAGNIETKFKLGKDTVRISADGFFRNLEPNYMLKKYVGNHFIWDNNFGKIRSFRAQGKLYIPWSKTELRVGFENIQNQIYFNSACLPQQYSGSVQIFSAAIDQKLQFGIWNWDNTLTYQASSNMEVMPLPSFALYSNMYLHFKAFRALTVQVGIDCDWYTKYRGYSYQPATMTFHSQGSGGIDTGNFIMSNVYLTARLYKVRLFLMCSHLNQGWFSKNYFSMPHYPIDPRQFRLGLSIDFVN